MDQLDLSKYTFLPFGVTGSLSATRGMIKEVYSVSDDANKLKLEECYKELELLANSLNLLFKNQFLGQTPEPTLSFADVPGPE